VREIENKNLQNGKKNRKKQAKMTTKEFIEMLQKADPQGNAHVRMSGGVPIFAEPKTGYWDGPYSYIENGKFITTSKGSKVDIHCVEAEDFMEDFVDIHDENNWEKVLSRYEYDFDNFSIPAQREEKRQSRIKALKKEYDELVEHKKKWYKESVEQALKRAEEGWQFFQNKKVETEKIHTYYMWKIIDPSGKENNSSVHDTEGILKSGLFEKLDNSRREGYYEWKLKSNAST
jgi:hypothetical protein